MQPWHMVACIHGLLVTGKTGGPDLAEALEVS